MCLAGVLALMAIYVGVAHSWDIAISVKEQLIFYTNGTKTDTVNLISQNPTALVYDEVHNIMLYVDKQSNNDAVCGYNLSSKDNKCFITRNGRNIHGLAFDPVTEKIFFTDTNERSINFISLKRGSNNNIYGNLLMKMDDINQKPADIAVDSCKGNIYWTHTINDGKIMTARFNGSERKVISLQISYYKAFSLAIDPQLQKMFYFDVCEACAQSQGYLNKADLSGKNERVLINDFHGPKSVSKVLTVSKDYIYYKNSSESYDFVWQLPKSTINNNFQPKEILKFQTDSTLGMVANYKLDEQIKGIQVCGSLSSLIPTITEVSSFTGAWRDVCEKYCLKGNCSINDEGLPKCSCNAGYTGERCEVSACHGYCLNDGTCSLIEKSDPVCNCIGDNKGNSCNCSFDNEELPKCSCNAGYSGERCEVSACHGYCSNNGDCSLNENSEPVCQCKRDYAGDRCEVSICLNYCMQGNCSFNDEGLPKCSCYAGYTGERCEVSVCHSYCLNDGTCSLNENSGPVCQCKGDHKGNRCEVSDCRNYCMQGNCSYNDEGHPTCSCNAGYSGERCEVSACLGYCSLNGDCSLNENSEPVCQCKGNYSGDRCEITDCLNYCMQGNCSFNNEGYPSCSCNAGYSGERCEVSTCHSYCLNEGDCSLNEEDEPVCQCDGNHEGSRCEIVKNNTFTFSSTPTYYSAQKNLTLSDLLSNWRKPTAKISITVEV